MIHHSIRNFMEISKIVIKFYESLNLTVGGIKGRTTVITPYNLNDDVIRVT